MLEIWEIISLGVFSLIINDLSQRGEKKTNKTKHINVKTYYNKQGITQPKKKKMIFFYKSELSFFFRFVGNIFITNMLLAFNNQIRFFFLLIVKFKCKRQTGWQSEHLSSSINFQHFHFFFCAVLLNCLFLKFKMCKYL